MSKQELIEKTINALQKLSADKVAEVADFTDFIRMPRCVSPRTGTIKTR